MRTILQTFRRLLIRSDMRDWEDCSLIIAAKALMSSASWRSTPDFADPFWVQGKEFRIYSQFGDDGIIQWLIDYLALPKRGRFIEFGVGDYYESNTHFLLVNNRWAGYVIDGDEANIGLLRGSPIFWRYRLHAECHFITRENIMSLLENSGFGKIDLLHIDLDGNDYWILESLDLNVYRPDILILEYNALFGAERPISVPYDPSFNRFKSHYSGKYFGASLRALNDLARKKGYYFIGCNSAGNNAYFLAEIHQSKVPQTNLSEGFQSAGFREARDKAGALSFADSAKEAQIIKGRLVVDVRLGETQEF